MIIFYGAFCCYADGDGNADYLRSHQIMRASVKAILKDSRFQYRDNLHWLNWIMKKLEVLFGRSVKERPAKQSNPWVSAIIKWLSILMALALPFIILFLMSRFFNYDIHLKRQKTAPQVAKILDAAQLRALSFSMAESGKYWEAIHYLYLAGLERMKDDGILPDAIRYSDQENLKTVKKLLGANHGKYLAFLSLVMIFREKWYGMKVCQENDFLRASQLLSAIIEY